MLPFPLRELWHLFRPRNSELQTHSKTMEVPEVRWSLESAVADLTCGQTRTYLVSSCP